MSRAMRKESDPVAEALKIISRKPLSAAMLENDLRKRGFDMLDIERAIRRLSEMGYLDDEAFAKDLVLRRRRARPSGTALIRMELEAKGICPAVIEKVLLESAEYGSDLDAARAAAQRWLRRAALGKEITRDQARKLGSHLKSRGFGLEVIARVVAELTGIAIEDMEQD